MSIIAWLVVGLIAGWIANLIMSRGNGGLVTDLLVGIVGAMAGGFLGGLLFGQDYITGINLQTIFVAVLGAIVVVAAYRALSGQAVRR